MDCVYIVRSDKYRLVFSEKSEAYMFKKQHSVADIFK